MYPFIMDPASSPQVIAAIWVAGGAVIVGLCNIAVTIWQGVATRNAAHKKDAREQWWERFTWAAERVSGPDDDYRYLGATVLSSLASVDWIQAEDKELIDHVLENLTDEVSEEDVEEEYSG